MPQLPEHLPPLSISVIFEPAIQPYPVEALAPEIAMETLPAPTGTVKVAIACLAVVTPFRRLRDNPVPTGQPRPSRALAPETEMLKEPEVGGTVKFAANSEPFGQEPPMIFNGNVPTVQPFPFAWLLPWTVMIGTPEPERVTVKINLH